MRHVSKKRVPEPTPQNRVSVLFVFSFLAVLGCVGAAAWLFLIDPRDEKPGILTASVEIGAPIIIETDAEPVPTELENAASAAPAPTVTEAAPEPAEEPAPAAEIAPEKTLEAAEPEKAPGAVASEEPVQAPKTSDAPAEPEIVKAEEPVSDEQPVEETLPAVQETEAEPELPVVITEAAPTPVVPTEEEIAVTESDETLPLNPESEDVVSSVPPAPVPEEPVAASEKLEKEEEETGPVIAAVEEEATDPPPLPQQPDPVETPPATAPEAPLVEEAAEAVIEPEIAAVAPEPEPVLEQDEQQAPVPSIAAAPPQEDQLEPVTETTELSPAADTVEVLEPDVASVETETPATEPDPSAEVAEAAAPLVPSPPAAETPEVVAVAEPEPVLQQELVAAEEPSSELTETSDSAANTEEEAPIETALVIPPAPVVSEDTTESIAPEPVVAAAPISPAKLLWQTHARAFKDPLDRPRIALIISEMGVSSVGTAAAIDGLPGAVTLAFNPYGQNLQSWITKARDAGHEVLLQLPMEPVGYPKINPGPQALLTSLDAAANLERLEWVLGRMEGYVGITNQMGSRFTASKEHIRPVLEVVKDKGLLYLDSRTASNSVGAQVASELSMPVALNNRFVDHKADGDIIDARLAELEEIARKTGSAVGVAYPYSLTLEHISRWAEGLADKDIVLAPVSALVNRQDIK